MIPRECKRLAEVDFPITVVSRHLNYAQIHFATAFVAGWRSS